MKHGIIITAYKNLQHLLLMADFFDDDFLLFIHLDKKMSYPENELQQLLNHPRIAFVSRQYEVNWGGFNHLKSLLLLAEEAVKDPEVGYVHSISGGDYPIQSADAFKKIMREAEGKEFLDHWPMPAPFWKGGGFDRICYYNFYDQYNARTHRGYQMIDRLIRLQKALGIKRKLPAVFPAMHGGSTWWSLSRACTEYLVSFTRNNKRVFNRFRYTFCSEEIYVHTVLLNSPFKDKVVKDNLRYIDWAKRDGNVPVVLDERDWEAIRGSEKLFARKFEYPISAKLIEKINQHLSIPGK
ncbi:MAG: beta-1,6-N-acetylglucosaminyltransferase [Candidatus Pseudobacter hemicellulosilyticus]|uniref:Peptide O-xylosyltransferase n=1 Tax=Candidatus Pseudobacter hemicellulosilyticus TaxID=3121375 RepID=A0AAJ5WTZ6_9BACT|nr:MAG: beta-1,6-N-acetylglucosaminyltransferase [Pseudobacter sp.]